MTRFTLYVPDLKPLSHQANIRHAARGSYLLPAYRKARESFMAQVKAMLGDEFFLLYDQIQEHYKKHLPIAVTFWSHSADWYTKGTKTQPSRRKLRMDAGDNYIKPLRDFFSELFEIDDSLILGSLIPMPPKDDKHLLKIRVHLLTGPVIDESFIVLDTTCTWSDD